LWGVLHAGDLAQRLCWKQGFVIHSGENF